MTEWITPREAADLYGISRTFFYRAYLRNPKHDLVVTVRGEKNSPKPRYLIDKASVERDLRSRVLTYPKGSSKREKQV